jgi:hypothetical protein
MAFLLFKELRARGAAHNAAPIVAEKLARTGDEGQQKPHCGP